MSNSLLRHSGMARNEGSQSFTCHPHVLSISGMNHTYLYSPAAQRLPTLVGTHFPSRLW